jgi:hypothetical protein
LIFIIQVVDFQPYYTFNPRRINDLQIGTAVLKEFMDLENERAERAARSKVDQKALREAITNQVRRRPQAFLLLLTETYVNR